MTFSKIGWVMDSTWDDRKWQTKSCKDKMVDVSNLGRCMYKGRLLCVSLHEHEGNQDNERVSVKEKAS